jgi:hypothetical protein
MAARAPLDLTAGVTGLHQSSGFSLTSFSSAAEIKHYEAGCSFRSEQVISSVRRLGHEYNRSGSARLTLSRPPRLKN